LNQKQQHNQLLLLSPQVQHHNNPGTDLSIADLKNLGTIIDVASTRGAFRANEMATVGAMYNKLQAFLARVAPEPKPEAKTAEAAAPAGK
jgi:hypothetical protein